MTTGSSKTNTKHNPKGEIHNEGRVINRRIAKFGGDFDPIRVAVDEAVAAFSSGKDEAGREADRSLWLKIANRAGLDAFLDAFDQKMAEVEELERDHRRLRYPASSFQKLLNKRFPKEGGAA